MISAPVLAAAKRRGVKPRRDPWGSIDGQGTSNCVGNGAQPATLGSVSGRIAHGLPLGSAQRPRLGPGPDAKTA
jgi:hypothetical protein